MLEIYNQMLLFRLNWAFFSDCIFPLDNDSNPTFQNQVVLDLSQLVLRWWQTRTQCCGHIVAHTNVSPFARARNICCGHKTCVRDTKMFLISFRNILCPQQMFPGLRSIETIMNNNVSVTLCPRLPPPLV